MAELCSFKCLKLYTLNFAIAHAQIKTVIPIKIDHNHNQGAEVTGQWRVNGIVRHLRRCTLEDQSLALKRKHRVHKYVNTATICVSVMTLFILT